MKQPVVFLCHTNYHLLFSISIILENYNDSEKFDVMLVHTQKLKAGPDLNDLNCTYRFFDKSEKNHRLSPQSLGFLKEIIALKPKRFFHFNEDEFIGVYLSAVLGKNGTIICLCQDGLKAYAIIDKPALKYRLSRTIDFYKFLRANGFRLFPYFFNIKYGRAWSTNELWLSHPEHSLLKSKPSKKVNFFISEDEVRLSKKAFGFSNEGFQSNGVIFYVSSIVKNAPAILKVEKKIIEELQQKFPDKKIYLKVHPRTPKAILDDIGSIQGIEIINNELPAEFYTSELTNSVVIGSYSAALVYDNPLAKFYWMYPLYIKHIPTFRYTILVNPATHIDIIDDVEKIKF